MKNDDHTLPAAARGPAPCNREIDALVAEHCMGIMPEWWLNATETRLPDYSTDPAASKQLRDKMRADGWSWSRTDCLPVGHTSVVYQDGVAPDAWAETEEMADALAALEAAPHAPNCRSLQRVHQTGYVHFETDAGEPCPDWHFRPLGACNCWKSALAAGVVAHITAHSEIITSALKEAEGMDHSRMRDPRLLSPAAVAELIGRVRDMGLAGTGSALAAHITAQSEILAAALKEAEEIERHCPCGARPESLRTHPHVISCPVEALIAILKGEKP